MLGDVIATVEAGSRIVVTASGAPAVKAGDRVLIHGFDRQVTPSDPCCAGYFEYHRAEQVTGSSITLRAPLRFGYDAGWFDGIHQSNGGAPRILSLDRPDFTQIERLHLRNLTISANPAWTTKIATPERNGRIHVYGYDEAILENVTAEAMYIGQGRSFTARDCKVTVQIEADKLIERIHLQSCVLPDIGGWTSVESVTSAPAVSM